MIKKVHRKGIYAIICKRNNKIYIGMTRVSFYSRWRHHVTHLQENRHSNKALQNDFNQFGASAFVFKIIEILDNNDLIEYREKYYINYYAITHKKIYNVRDVLIKR